MTDISQTTQVSEEEIKKSLAVLGISEDEFFKAKKESESTEEDKEETEGKKDSEKKEETEDEAFEKSYNEFKEMKKAFKSKKCDLEKAFPDKFNAKDKADDEADEKDIKKSEENEIGKTDNSGELLKSLEDSLTSKFEALTIIIKGQQDTISSLRSEMESIGKTSARKSLTSNTQVIEKSFQSGFDQSTGKTVLSLSQNRNEIDNTLLELSGIEKGEVNDLYKDAALCFNASGQLTQNVIVDLYRNKNIQIVQ